MIARALQADDGALPSALDKPEAELQRVPETMSKAEAIEMLKGKIISFDGPTVVRLYEELKRGFYEARNKALSPIADIKRQAPSPDRATSPNRAAKPRARE